jgi:hypothetical protein
VTSTIPAGERVVQGQRLMQATPDVFLGFHAVKKGASTRHYYVRQLYDNKAAIAVDQARRVAARLLRTNLCVDARASPRARGRRRGDRGYLGKSDVADEAFAEFAWPTATER